MGDKGLISLVIGIILLSVGAGLAIFESIVNSQIRRKKGRFHGVISAERRHLGKGMVQCRRERAYRTRLETLKTRSAERDQASGQTYAHGWQDSRLH